MTKYLFFSLQSNNGAPTKKLVILVTDEAPNGLFTPLTGLDPWIMSKEFAKKGITLVVVGFGESIFECYDFYCALARNTGVNKFFELYLYKFFFFQFKVANTFLWSMHNKLFH